MLQRSLLRRHRAFCILVVEVLNEAVKLLLPLLQLGVRDVDVLSHLCSASRNVRK